VFLAGEQPVIALAFTDRGDKSVDQHARALGRSELLVVLRAGHPPQDRLQDLVIPDDRGLRQPNTSPTTSSATLCRNPNNTATTAAGRVSTCGRPTGGFSHGPTASRTRLTRSASCWVDSPVKTLSPRRLALDHLSPHN
jgi:hypothetical protein